MSWSHTSQPPFQSIRTFSPNSSGSPGMEKQLPGSLSALCNKCLHSSTASGVSNWLSVQWVSRPRFGGSTATPPASLRCCQATRVGLCHSFLSSSTLPSLSEIILCTSFDFSHFIRPRSGCSYLFLTPLLLCCGPWETSGCCAHADPVPAMNLTGMDAPREVSLSCTLNLFFSLEVHFFCSLTFVYVF